MCLPTPDREVCPGAPFISERDAVPMIGLANNRKIRFVLSRNKACPLRIAFLLHSPNYYKLPFIQRANLSHSIHKASQRSFRIHRAASVEQDAILFYLYFTRYCINMTKQDHLLRAPSHYTDGLTCFINISIVIAQ